MISDDHYNTLSIASVGPATLLDSKKEHFHSETLALRNPVDNSDIEGTRFTSRYEKYTNKPNLYQSGDIEGSTSKILIKPVIGRVNYSLRNDDIPGAKTEILDPMLRTNRHVDPLMPKYSLPSYAAAEPYQPKFIRDTLVISDIDGSAPIPRLHTTVKLSYEHQPKDILGLTDIEGSNADYKHYIT